MVKKSIITVKDTNIRTMTINGIDYVCITDIARQKNAEEPKDVVKNWMRLKNTIEYMGLWEKLNNPQFNGVGFDPLFQEAGSNAFTLSPTKWIEQTNAIGIVCVAGRNGGTYAQRDIAFKFANTAKEWRDANPDKKGNIRDYATITELSCLSNMENLNAVFINDGLPQSERLIKLNKIAIQQMNVLEYDTGRKLLR